MIFLSTVLLFSILYSTIQTGISPMPSSRSGRIDMLKLCPIVPKVCIDLGSGWGGLLRLAAQRYPNAQIIGYETSWIPYLYSRIVCKEQNITILRRSFLHEAFPPKTIFFCYLCPYSMTVLSDHCPTSGWLISNTFALPGHRPDCVLPQHDVYKTSIYVYRLHDE